MNVEPKLSMFLSSVAAIVSTLGITQLQSLGFTEHTEAISAWLLIGNGVLNAFLHAYSSTSPGPFSGDAKVGK